MTNELKEKIIKELIDLYVAPNQRSTVKECVIGNAEYKGTVRINASAIPLFRNFYSTLDQALEAERKRVLEMIGGMKQVKSEKCGNCGGEGQTTKCIGGSDWTMKDSYNQALQDLKTKLSTSLK